MRNNVVNHYGQSQFGDLPVCAKSGTAEVGGDSAPHAWFTGFIDSDEYPYAFVVIIENGGWGSQQAGAVAAQVLESACTPEAESEE
jgi:peptidoglycan glycosyltransferase